jgi:signal peptidase I
LIQAAALGPRAEKASRSRAPDDRMTEGLIQTDKQGDDRQSLLETLEAIVIAFVLAFIFRAFIVEAFVIPTGSMAPTLYGAHAEVVCGDCGEKFAVGAEDKSPERCVCPNCFLSQDITNRRPYSGDRLLVLKYLYDFQAPHRWDVLVFHNPNNPAENYIKRLVALPGETIELIDGNVTINGRIAHKTDRAQDALWQLVHDTNYQPHRADWRPRWAGDAEWRGQEAGFFMDKAPANGKTAWLEYRHWVPRGDHEYVLSNIMDFYGYDSALMMGNEVCTDLAVKSSVTVRDRMSVVVIELRALKDVFRFELTAVGSQAPSRISINNAVVAQSADGVLPVGKAVVVQAANVDHKVMLRVNGGRPLKAVSPDLETTVEGDVCYVPRSVTTLERKNFESPDLLEPKYLATEVKVGAQSGPVDLAYLRLDRDVYYTNQFRPGSQENPFALEAKEYFVLGDNSPRSADSRLWNLERPVVPQRNLVGKAFFVYWPAAGWRSGIPVAPDPTGWRLVH